MRQFKSEKEAYEWCLAEGHISHKADANTDRIRSNLIIAQECLESAQDDVGKKRWNSAYILHYDVLHLLAESLMLFDDVKSKSHQCLFTYLCVTYPKLEFNWNFFEKVRTKRNGINYYGTLVTQKDWKEVELQFSLYIRSLKKEVEEKLE